MTQDEFIAEAKAFFESRIGDEAAAITGDSDLVGSGIMDSLMLLEFFFFLEELNGSALDAESITTESLSTLNGAFALVS